MLLVRDRPHANDDEHAADLRSLAPGREPVEDGRPHAVPDLVAERPERARTRHR